MNEPKTNKDWLQLELQVARLFSAAPLSPDRSPDNGSEGGLYAGRSFEGHRMIEAVRDPAKHILLYGERGIGKTSTSNNFWTKDQNFSYPVLVVRSQAYPFDDFSSLWRRTLEELQIVAEQYACKEIRSDLTHVSPDSVRREFQKMPGHLISIIIIDEFDLLRTEEARLLTANLLKSLHDYGVNVTVVLIGVADDVEELVANHQSLRRVLSLIKLERMSFAELNEILDRRLQLTPLSLANDARSAIVGISCGLPYYVQTLGKFSAQNAIRGQRLQILLDDVNVAIEEFIIDNGQSFAEAYQRITESRKKGNMFQEVILAGALAQSDISGFFKSSEVARVLDLMVIDQPRNEFQIQRYLSQFASERRGRALIRRGIGAASRYRFSDATMQPFIIMRAINARRFEGGCRDFLFHWYKEKVHDASHRLNAADGSAGSGENGPEKTWTDPVQPAIEANITPTAIGNAGEEGSVPAPSGPRSVEEADIILTAEKASEESPALTASGPDPAVDAGISSTSSIENAPAEWRLTPNRLHVRWWIFLAAALVALSIFLRPAY
jgi:hypothetical protein